MSDLRLPDYAYVPGKNERHPEDTFDALRETATGDLDTEGLARCDAYRAGLVFLDSGFYWEAHEVLESVWMALPDGSVERLFVQGLIQLANGRLKLKMGRPKAALRLVGQARGLVPALGNGASMIMTLSVGDVQCWIDDLESEILLAL